MPPKKKTAATEGGEAEGGAFRWTLENEKKGRYLTSEDYERIVSVFPGTTKKAIQVRVSLLRVEQRKLFEEYGWSLPEGAAKAKGPGTPRKNIGTPKKRAADGGGGVEGHGSEDGTPKVKKARGRKAKGGEKEEQEEEDGGVEEDDVLMGKRVKEEEVEEMV